MRAELCIALVGFMGTGKSTVGRRVGKRLGWSFVDLDDVIETREERTIPEIFAQDGEALFRDCEHRALAAVLKGDPCVLATGGGVVIREENRALLRERCFSVCLNLPAEMVLARVSSDGSRPLLATEDPLGRIRELMAERAELYAQIPWQVDRERLDPQQTADEVVRLHQRFREVDIG